MYHFIYKFKHIFRENFRALSSCLKELKLEFLAKIEFIIRI